MLVKYKQQHKQHKFDLKILRHLAQVTILWTIVVANVFGAEAPKESVDATTVNAIDPHKEATGNNGYGNGGSDPAPGDSGSNGSPNADEKKEDKDR